jgi:hypothetical protein
MHERFSKEVLTQVLRAQGQEVFWKQTPSFAKDESFLKTANDILKEEGFPLAVGIQPHKFDLLSSCKTAPT